MFICAPSSQRLAYSASLCALTLWSAAKRPGLVLRVCRWVGPATWIECCARGQHDCGLQSVQLVWRRSDSPGRKPDTGGRQPYRALLVSGWWRRVACERQQCGAAERQCHWRVLLQRYGRWIAPRLWLHAVGYTTHPQHPAGMLTASPASLGPMGARRIAGWDMSYLPGGAAHSLGLVGSQVLHDKARAKIASVDDASCDRQLQRRLYCRRRLLSR